DRRRAARLPDQKLNPRSMAGGPAGDKEGRTLSGGSVSGRERIEGLPETTRWQAETVGGPDGEERPPHGEKRPPQDGGEGQALPLRQVPQAEPEARAHPRPLVLPELPEGERRLDPVTAAGLLGRRDAPGPARIADERTRPFTSGRRASGGTPASGRR